MLSIIQKLKKLLISYVTTGFEFCCFNMLIMSVTVLPLSVPYLAPPKGAGVCLLECYHFKGTEWVDWACGSPRGRANSLCPQNTSITFFSEFTISFYFLQGTKALFPSWKGASPFCILVEAILEVPCSVLKDSVVRFRNTFKVSLLKTVTSGEP